MYIMKRLYRIIILVLFNVLFYSCEDFIDLSPRDKITTEDYWKTTEDLKNYTLQFYPQMPLNKSWYAGRSDDMIVGGSPNGIMNGERTVRTGNWRGEWNPIRNINIFFDNYEKCEDVFEAYKHYVGEAHFFRAAFYFNLLKMYGDLPLYTKVLYADSDEELMKPRDPRTSVADMILEDLDKAISYLKYRKEVGNCTLSKEAALAFKTRVALYEGTWQKYHANTPFGTNGAEPDKYFQQCIDAAEELMNGNYKVGIYNTGKPEEDYFKLFGFANMSDIDEVILYIAYNLNDEVRNSTQTYVTREQNGKGATWGLITSYLDRNGKPYNYMGLAETTKGNAFLTKISNDIDPRLRYSIWMPGDLMSEVQGTYFEKPPIDAGALFLNPTGFAIKKTADPYAPSAGAQWNVYGETGFILLRYAEVLLNYAEAKCELDNSVAHSQLNLLRARAGMPNFTINPQNLDPNKVNYGYSISDELYEIRRERRVELALENLRDDDLFRWRAHSLFKNRRPKGYPIDVEEFPDYNLPIDENGLIDYYKKVIPNGYNFREDRDYLYSIPQDELIMNPNLVQNPGW